MISVFNKKVVLVIAMLVIGSIAYFLMVRDEQIDFSADVKPIINEKCISCHGGVRAKSGFSLLFREDAMAKTESGKPAIVPGDPGRSEIIRRISSHDPEERMPYKHEPLSDKEISILTRWIKQGAKWGDHWAYLPVKKTLVPDLEDQWIKNDVDKFIFEKIDEEKLRPAPQADKATLLRRVSLDLIGMYPSENVAKQYLKSTEVNAYELLVDSLLASPHFGERWATMWLDLARYADTKGYESDGGRRIWKYRDWVINAFNQDKPYDVFLTEQIAGDLLPDPTDAQYIATAFSRNSMTNDEGGTDNEEFRTAAVVDRVNTTWEALMGTSFSCVQCHSHPYDPFRHEEFYSFLAYFNNTRDEDMPMEYPLLREYNDSLVQQLAIITDWVEKHSSKEHAKDVKHFLRTWQPAINSATADSLRNAVIDNNNIALAFRNNAVARLKKVDLQNKNQLIYNYYSNRNGGVLTLHLGSPDGTAIATSKMVASDKWQYASIDFPTQNKAHDVYLRYENRLIPENNDDFHVRFDRLLFTRQFPGKGADGYEKNKELYWNLLTANVSTTPVMVENPSGMWRTTNVFERGNWRTLGKEVKPSVPNSLSIAMPANAPQNRMGLAIWLTDKKNPLVSRTIVNRLWEQLFGTGIVETLEDMGTQGMPPTHKELLDHISWKLMHDYKWSIKKLLKELVMSATYRQDSRVPEELKQKDLFNKLYARGPRIRLSAEQLRDQHLCISGKLSKKMFGPGVMPWQPEGIWLSPYNGEKWINAGGEEQYRRAVYTYWKRTAPYPSMIAFDAAQRVVCNSRRIPTNTPLQALVSLNDSAYLDMARHFAYRMKKGSENNVQQQISKGYEMMLYKPIPQSKLQVFVDLYHTAFDEFKHDARKTDEMMGMNNSEHNNASTAALVVVANAMLNLDEVIMKN